MSEPLSELLAGLASAFSAQGSRWYLFGAQAVVLWGRPRLTADVDVTVEVDPGAICATLRLLEDALGQSDLLPRFEEEWRLPGGST